jgi:pyridoxamine 5'-phosphate oxidase
MNKVFELFATGKGKGDLAQSRSGSGGGGPVEAVYWVKDIRVQWRLRGKCWLVAADDIEGGDAAQNSGTITVKAEVGRYMRPKGNHESQNDDWSWKREVENLFENLSPIMRGSFKNPPPGRPLSEGGDSQDEKLGQKGGHLKDEDLARKNFRVAIITPEEVEQVDLSDPENSKRWIWTLTEEAGGPGANESGNPVQEWNMVETWP